MKEWHKQAREMRAAGMTLRAIGDVFGVTNTAVMYATDERYRSSRLAYSKMRYRRDPEACTAAVLRSNRRRRERALAVAREYGCGDEV